MRDGLSPEAVSSLDELPGGGLGIHVILAIGLLLLYGALYRIVAGASRRLPADENQHQALHDSLTGLPNRSSFYDLTQELLADLSCLVALYRRKVRKVREANPGRCPIWAPGWIASTGNAPDRPLLLLQRRP
jgi:hypothetical protein